LLDHHRETPTTTAAATGDRTSGRTNLFPFETMTDHGPRPTKELKNDFRSCEARFRDDVFATRFKRLSRPDAVLLDSYASEQKKKKRQKSYCAEKVKPSANSPSN
jgi:hypothetical protein